mmetsp:Transcript_26132/g.56009  ORF Transcript_26132/g.56009 Transcript_26132/m.56009 type:complete len:80 (-) Transcript_26132:260-499(-)
MLAMCVALTGAFWLKRCYTMSGRAVPCYDDTENFFLEDRISLDGRKLATERNEFRVDSAAFSVVFLTAVIEISVDPFVE